MAEEINNQWVALRAIERVAQMKGKTEDEIVGALCAEVVAACVLIEGGVHDMLLSLKDTISREDAELLVSTVSEGAKIADFIEERLR